MNDEIDRLVATLRSFGRAYPEDVFVPLTPEQTNANRMGRHCAKFMSQAADMIEQLATATAVQPEVERLVRQIHQAVKRSEGTQDHGVVGNLRCILDHALPDVPDFAAVQPEPVAHCDTQLWAAGEDAETCFSRLSFQGSSPVYAAPIEQPEPVAWQPIETAPQNKTIILANFDAADLLTGAPHVWAAYFASEDGWINGAGEKVKGPAMWCKQSYAATNENGLPTHWMPLPAAPSGDTSEKD